MNYDQKIQWTKVMLSQHYTSTLLEENGELILPLPQQLLDDLGWNENDELEWSLEENNQIVLKKL